MEHDDFMIGAEFEFADQRWHCTDKGTRVIVAIRVDHVEVGSNDPAQCRVLDCAEAENEGWFNRPPYAVAERVFDGYEQEACSPVQAPEAPAG